MKQHQMTIHPLFSSEATSILTVDSPDESTFLKTWLSGSAWLGKYNLISLIFAYFVIEIIPIYQTMNFMK